MQVLKKWLNLILLLLWGQTVCRSQNTAIQHLNLKLDRLNRITNGLQRDVDDIWTALSNTVSASSGKAILVSNQTDQGNLDAEEVLKLVNGTVSDVKELKTEVEELVVYAQNGLKNEKAFSRKVMKEIQTSQTVFEAKTSNDVTEMKIWLQSLEEKQRQTLEDMLENFRTKTENENRNLLEKMQNLTNNCEAKMEENKLEIQAINDKLESVGQNFTLVEKYITTEVAFVKQEIDEKIQEALTCENGWESFGTNCYFLSSEKMTWDDAWEFCRARDSHIVEVNDKEETEFLVQTCRAQLDSVWLGGNDRETEGTFVWQTSKKTVPSDSFYPGEPNNAGGNEDCTQLYCGGDRVQTLNDAICGHKKKFICEKSKYIFQ